MKVDILIKNGEVLDTYQGIREVRNVAVKGNKIVEVPDEGVEAGQVIDAKGCIVSPGFVDFHGHFADGVSDLGANPEMICFPTGVTTIVDGGTTGVSNYLAFRARTMASKLKTYGLLHINPSGISTIAYHEIQDPKYCQSEKMKMYMDLYRDQLIGLKVRQSRELVGELGLEPFRCLLRLAEEIGCFVAVHTTNPPCTVPEMLPLFRPGDVYCHVFQGRGNTIIAPNGHVYDEVWQAQKNGVIFDAANGKNHFSFRVAEAALADNFKPDVISTDMSAFNAFTRGRVFSLPYIMSKYLMLGLPLEEIYRCVTSNPAKQLGQEKELGSLLPGTVANITVQRIVDRETVFQDTFDEERVGKQVFRTELTVNQGQIVFRTIDV